MIVMIKIWDIADEKFWRNSEGEILLYENEIAAKNAMFTDGYKKEFVDTGVEFVDHVIIE